MLSVMPGPALPSISATLFSLPLAQGLARGTHHILASPRRWATPVFDSAGAGPSQSASARHHPARPPFDRLRASGGHALGEAKTSRVGRQRWRLRQGKPEKTLAGKARESA